MTKRLGAIVAALAMMFSATAIAAAPAQASWNACPDAYMCFWSNQSYWGTTAFYYRPVQTVCYPVSDWASSLRNRTGVKVRVFSGEQCSGTYVDIYNEQSFSPVPSPVGDNNANSFRAG